MDNIDGEKNIEIRVFLLGIYKKEEGESIKDIIDMMVNSGVFDLKTGKKYLKDLKKLEYVVDESLSMMGIQIAKEVELEFKI